MWPQDEELIERFLAGEPEAMATLDRWMERSAWPYRRRLGEEWEDLLQDSRLELTRLLRAGDFRGEARLKTYLWRVVNHACLDRMRAASRRRAVDLDEIAETLERDGLLASSQPLSHETRDLASRVLERVSEECRHLWQLIMLGLSYAEMSERLGVAGGTLRVRVLRCRKRAVEVRSELLGETRGDASTGPSGGGAV